VSASKKPLSLRARIARLNELIPEDPDRLCCLDGFVAWRETLLPHYESLETHLEPVYPEPSKLPLAGVCRKSGEPLCSFACDLVRLIWTRRRQVALDFAGLTEEALR
jgi:hypothetical protein